MLNDLVSLFPPPIVSIAMGVYLIRKGLKVYGQPVPGGEVMYWEHHFADLIEAPDAIYARVYQALQQGLQKFDVALSGFGFGPTHLFETRSILSERPLYLHAKYKHLDYYFYCGQTPAGTFVSTRLYDPFTPPEDKALSGKVYTYLKRETIFQFDATLMFAAAVHHIVMAVIDGYLQEHKLKPLEELEKRPVMHAFYKPGLRQQARLSALGVKQPEAPAPAAGVSLMSDTTRA